jgi:hypothetical protein
MLSSPLYTVLLINSSRAAEPEVVIKEVYVDVIKEVQVLVEVPVVREVRIEVPVEVIREVIVEVPVLNAPTTGAAEDSSTEAAESETARGETTSAVTAEERSSAKPLQESTFIGACALGAYMLSKRDYSSAAMAYKLGELASHQQHVFMNRVRFDSSRMLWLHVHAAKRSALLRSYCFDLS